MNLNVAVSTIIYMYVELMLNKKKLFSVVQYLLYECKLTLWIVKLEVSNIGFQE